MLSSFVGGTLRVKGAAGLVSGAVTITRSGPPVWAGLIPASSAAISQTRAFHIRHTYEVNQNSKKGLTDASFEVRKLLREDKINFTGRERRIKPTQERKMQEEKYIYQIEKRARKHIIKYIMAQIESRKKAKGQ